MTKTIFFAVLWFAVSCTRVNTVQNEALPPKGRTSYSDPVREVILS